MSARLTLSLRHLIYYLDQSECVRATATLVVLDHKSRTRERERFALVCRVYGYITDSRSYPRRPRFMSGTCIFCPLMRQRVYGAGLVTRLVGWLVGQQFAWPIRPLIHETIVSIRVRVVNSMVGWTVKCIECMHRQLRLAPNLAILESHDPRRI